LSIDNMIKHIIGIISLIVFTATSGLCGLFLLLLFCALLYNIGKEYGL